MQMAKANRFITLTTDFGLADCFVGVMKGVIHTINPDATIIDISHEIGSQDISSASFLFGSAYSYFPEGTIHVVVVDPGVGSKRRPIAVETEKFYFVAPDNGVLTYAIAREKIIKSVGLTNPAYFLSEVSDTFHGRDIFAPVSAHLSLGVPIELMGVEIDNLVEISLPNPEIGQGWLKGHVIHIDKFGNLITDISHNLFKSVVSCSRFVIRLADIEIDRISQSYADVPVGKPLAIFDSFGNLEIALNCDSAEKVLGVKKGDIVNISILA